MNVGGTEKALLTMFSEIDKEKYDVTLLMLEEFGGFLDDIPEWVNIKYVNYYSDIKSVLNKPLHTTALEQVKSGRIGEFIKYSYFYLLSKIKKDRIFLFKHILKNYPNLEKEYDLAVAYAGPMDFISYFVTNKIKAKKKIQWVHFDITKINFNYKFAEKIYSKFNKILVVSEQAKYKVIENLPSLKDNVEVFYNIVSQNLVRRISDEESFTDEFNGIRILTVGRFTKEKNQSMTIPILARLKSDGYNVRWYCIGDGGDYKSECERLIKSYNLEDSYILLGTKTNPYPYMKDCDLYVQPSLHEGYCITLAEARCFDNPIIATNFTGAREQLIETGCGIVSNINENDLYLKIKEIFDNDKLREKIKSNLRNHTFDTSKEIDKLYKVVND
jgi:glycosyltransferase involved in cell wall biosynthesis